MPTNRQNLLNKIRALLAKTVENGCTEAEALSALSMAQAMMDAYEVTDADLEIGDEKATVQDYDVNDPKGIGKMLCVVISRFCEVKVWRKAKKGLTFVGLQSDVDFAIWLLDSLTTFVQSQLTHYLFINSYTFRQQGSRQLHIKSFVLGCCNRINERMQELIDNRKQSVNKNALIVLKQSLIDAKMKELNINLTKGRNRGRQINDGYAAGMEAGDRATFGRPVNNGQTVFRIGKS